MYWMLLVKVKARNLARKRSIVRKESSFSSSFNRRARPLSPDQPSLERAEPLCLAFSMTSFSNIPSSIWLLYSAIHQLPTITFLTAQSITSSLFLDNVSSLQRLYFTNSKLELDRTHDRLSIRPLKDVYCPYFQIP